MQFKIPQNVQREDTIVAFLTLRHLIILSIGGGLAYSIYVILARQYFWEIWAPPVILISLLTLAVAFLKINDIPFLKWVLLEIEFTINCQKRSWQKNVPGSFISIFSDSSPKILNLPKKSQKQAQKNQATWQNLNDISQILDNYGK